MNGITIDTAQIGGLLAFVVTVILIPLVKWFYGRQEQTRKDLAKGLSSIREKLENFDSRITAAETNIAADHGWLENQDERVRIIGRLEADVDNLKGRLGESKR